MRSPARRGGDSQKHAEGRALNNLKVVDRQANVKFFVSLKSGLESNQGHDLSTTAKWLSALLNNLSRARVRACGKCREMPVEEFSRVVWRGLGNIQEDESWSSSPRGVNSPCSWFVNKPIP